MLEDETKKVEHALSRVVSDLVTSGVSPHEARISDAPGQVTARARRGGSNEETGVYVHYGKHQVLVDRKLSSEELTVRIAQFVQDDVIRELHSAWPITPGRNAPLDARIDSKTGLASWMDEKRAIDIIGELDASA